MILAVERTTELKIHIYRFDNVNDECNGSSSPGSAQRFLSVHASIYNTFYVQRHFNFPKDITPVSRRSDELMADCDRGRVIRIPNQIRSTEIQQRDNALKLIALLYERFCAEEVN